MQNTDLELNDRVLNVESAVRGERLRDNEKSLGERLHTHLDPSFGVLLHRTSEVRRAGDFERTCARDQGFVLQSVLDRAQTVAKGVLRLLNGVRVWTFDEESDTFWVLDVLDESELLLAQGMFVHETCPAEDVWCEVID